ncbi:uncharacterized protein Patsas isoform X2 [Diabrotica undecimpunctata]|uniref:uncharacterized protein Patsas isoform X2 n=1 Tax=Diabrotica undecimpunctata TaxID=50387 RepID=UPI003B638663
MVADTDHPTTVTANHEKDGSEADINEYSLRSIFDLVKSGELSEIVEYVEKSGCEVLRARDEWGYTPAHWAALDGNVEIMRYIVDKGAPIDLPCLGTQGPRPIHWACRKGHTAAVQVLLQAGVAVNAADFKGLTPLMTACMFGRTATAAFLLGMGASNDLMDINGDTALHWAAYKGHADLIRLLMYSGSNLQKPDHFGSTPLHLACLSGNLTCVKLLCEKCIPITWNILRGSHYCFIYWNVVMWICWIVANRKNPGYIPMNSESYHRSIKQIPMFDKWKKRNSILNRLCHTCRCLRPLRAKHCRICNRCVSYFDHHCPFIYNCVGLRNRTWFFLFVMSIAVNCSFTIYFAMYCIALEGFGILYILGLLEAFIFSGLGWILTCTSILHACMNLTTNEMFNYKRYPYLRDKRGRYLNPFSRGPILNLIEFFFCTPEDYDDDYGYDYI